MGVNSSAAKWTAMWFCKVLFNSLEIKQNNRKIDNWFDDSITRMVAYKINYLIGSVKCLCLQFFHFPAACCCPFYYPEGRTHRNSSLFLVHEKQCCFYHWIFCSARDLFQTALVKVGRKENWRPSVNRNWNSIICREWKAGNLITRD